MPEGPELHHASLFINQVSKGRIFTGKIVKSEVHKSKEVDWDHGDYLVSAVSRGKELKLTLTSVTQKEIKDTKKGSIQKTKSLDIMIQFGMSGRFHFCNVEEMEKHSHLNFFTKAEKGQHAQVLSFVDYRRFGKWQIGADWSPDRGPCVLFEYPAFREQVLKNLHQRAFNKPICEVMLNQKYFNGIGNYLRAEILYRCKIRPFECARSVLENLTSREEKKVVKSENPDVLELCHLLPHEVLNLELLHDGANGYITDEKSATKFMDWLQCYYNPNMTNMSDHNKRTMWFTGDPGPLVPKEQKTRGMKKSSKAAKRKSENTESEEEEADSPKKKKKSNRQITRQKLKEAMQEKTVKNKPRSKANSRKKMSDQKDEAKTSKTENSSSKKTKETKAQKSKNSVKLKTSGESGKSKAKRSETSAKSKTSLTKETCESKTTKSNTSAKSKKNSSISGSQRKGSKTEIHNGGDASINNGKTINGSLITAVRRSSRSSSMDSTNSVHSCSSSQSKLKSRNHSYSKKAAKA